MEQDKRLKEICDELLSLMMSVYALKFKLEEKEGQIKVLFSELDELSGGHNQ